MDHILPFLTATAHYAIPFLIVLGVVVFAHEFGHYWVARRCGVLVESFSIGFGREIFGWNDAHGTRWKVSWMPLGGYVKMFGDSDPSSATPDENVKTMTEDEKKVAFYHQPVGKRAAIVVAGPLANYVFAIIVLAVLFAFNGQPYTAPVVDKIVEDGVAAKAGIKAGDHVLRVDDQAIDSFEDIKRIVAMNLGAPLRMDIERDGAKQTVILTPEVVETTDRLGGEHRMGRIGIASSVLNYRHLSPMESVEQSALETWNMTTATLKGVYQIIIGVRGSEELGGPLRIAEMSGKVAQDGAAALFWFMAIISINLGLINLFPVPLLDGGHLAFYAIEALRGKPLSERAQEYGARAGGALVLALMLFATWNDLVHLRVVSYLRGLLS